MRVLGKPCLAGSSSLLSSPGRHSLFGKLGGCSPASQLFLILRPRIMFPVDVYNFGQFSELPRCTIGNAPPGSSSHEGNRPAIYAAHLGECQREESAKNRSEERRVGKEC